MNMKNARMWGKTETNQFVFNGEDNTNGPLVTWPSATGIMSSRITGGFKLFNNRNFRQKKQIQSH